MKPDLLVLSRYGPLGASSRIRIYQYIEALRASGLRVEVRPLFDDAYVRSRNRDQRPAAIGVAGSYWRRVISMIGASRARALWIEYEALPWLPYGLEQALLRSTRPIIVDYDDAIFHRYDLHRAASVRTLLGKKIARIMRSAELVVVGNEYLADYASEAGARRIEMLPSVIDLRRYRQRSAFASGEFVVGWIGSYSTTPYLRMLESVLTDIAARVPMRVMNVGGASWRPRGLRVDELPWTESTEVDHMLQFDVGVMPLPDDPWTRGKCGFKLIQYMGCALPTIASPVGVNTRIVEPNTTGFLASTNGEWVEAVQALAASPALRAEMGQRGFAKVAREYSLDATTPRLVRLVESVIRRSRA